MNLQEIRDRLNKLNNKTSKKNDLWKPKDEHLIRCLPYPHGDEPFLELGFHYDIGKTRTVLCPKFNYGEDCAICDFAERLWSFKDENGDDKSPQVKASDAAIYKDVRVKERYYIPMVERMNDGGLSEPKLWAFSYGIYNKLLEMCGDEEMNEGRTDENNGAGVLTDIEDAYDITINFKQAENKDGKGNLKKYPEIVIKEKKKSSPLGLGKAETEALLAKVPNIENVYDRMSSKEVQKIFNGFINENASELDGSKEDAGVEYESNSAERPVEGGQSIDEAFGELVGE